MNPVPALKPKTGSYDPFVASEPRDDERRNHRKEGRTRTGKIKSNAADSKGRRAPRKGRRLMRGACLQKEGDEEKNQSKSRDQITERK